ncbi:MAG: class I SAM-dependent methyltransferase [bacterium]|nr:class I SAM-dependent methyltransferase [bacterium]
MSSQPRCRSCGADLRTTFVDLGVSPLSNSYVPADALGRMEPYYPLHAFVCDVCFLVQVEAYETPEAIFSNYAYLSSYSDSWLAHCETYAALAIERLGLEPNAFVVEAASNDGYLLRYFKERGLRTLGIEPARNVAEIARERGIETEAIFLGVASGNDVRGRHGAADLVIANNVIAHVPDVHDFFGGLRALLAPNGTITVEFPHLVRLIEGVEFDTIYHEHFSYYSLFALEALLAKVGLKAVDVDRLSTHGGSLRVWIRHASDVRPETAALDALRGEERRFGITDSSTYAAFAERVATRKREIWQFLISAAEAGKSVAGYGAPAKGNTLLNYCGIKPSEIPFTVDRNPLKVGTYLPGSRIPVFSPERLRERKPDYVLILPWNIRDEVTEQVGFIREWGGRFVVAMPRLEVM